MKMEYNRRFWIILTIFMLCVPLVSSQTGDGLTPCKAPLDKCKCRAENGKELEAVCENISGLTVDQLKKWELPRDLNTLKITGNKIEEITGSLFGDCRLGSEPKYPNLKTLNMSNNSIHKISDDAFSCVLNVTELYLDNNHYQVKGNPSILDNFVDLEVLSMNNALNLMETDSLDKLFRIDFEETQGLSKLKKLFLSDNDIGQVHDELFCTLKNLEELYLSRNRISNLDGIIICYDNMKIVHLDNNGITTVDNTVITEIIEEIDLWKEIKLEGNPFLCDCSLKDFQMFLKNPNVSKVFINADKLTCHAPDELKDKPIISVDLGTCEQNPASKSPVEYVVPVMIVVVLIVIIVLCVLGFMDRLPGQDRRNKTFEMGVLKKNKYEHFA